MLFGGGAKFSFIPRRRVPSLYHWVREAQSTVFVWHETTKRYTNLVLPHV